MSSWVLSVDWNEADATSAGIARAEYPRNACRRMAGISLDEAVPAKSVGRVMEINDISQERCTEINTPNIDLEPFIFTYIQSA